MQHTPERVEVGRGEQEECQKDGAYHARRIFFTQPAFDLLTLGEGNMLDFSGNGATIRLGAMVHGVCFLVKRLL